MHRLLKRSSPVVERGGGNPCPDDYPAACLTDGSVPRSPGSVADATCRKLR